MVSYRKSWSTNRHGGWRTSGGITMGMYTEFHFNGEIAAFFIYVIAIAVAVTVGGVWLIDKFSQGTT